MLQSQIEPIKTLDIGEPANQIYLHSSTGIPIFQTSGQYVAVHPSSNEVLWKTDRSGLAKFSELGDGSGEIPDYYELPASLLAYIGNSIIDVSTGKIIVDGGQEAVRGLSAFNLFPAEDLMVVKLYIKGGYKLYGIDPIKQELKWSTLIDEASGLSQVLAKDDNPYTSMRKGLKPFITENGNLLFQHRKYLLSINPKDGAVNWKLKMEPGQVLFNEAGTRMAIAMERGGLGGAITVTGGSSNLPPKLSKKVLVIDAESGENVWKKEVKMEGQVRYMKPHDGGFLVVHDEGLNIFDFDDPKGEGRWKKDLKQKGVYDVVLEPEGLMVYFKNKRQLIDEADGKEIWKKAEKLDYEVEEYSTSEQKGKEADNITIYEANTYIRVRNNANNRSRRLNSDFYLDDIEANRVIAVGLSDRDPKTIRIGAPGYTVNILDLNTFKQASDLISQPLGFYAVDKVDSGYFIYGNRGFNS